MNLKDILLPIEKELNVTSFTVDHRDGFNQCRDEVAQRIEGLKMSEEKIADVLMDKDMEWYPYKDRLLPHKQAELLAKAIANTKDIWKGGE